MAYLVLSNGMVFPGERAGAGGDAAGEAVFTTGMTGYLETLTDPSYAGQIVTQTFPLIGNYGVIPADFEGRCSLNGYVVHELCAAPSNFRSEGTLDAFLKDRGIPALVGVDTRALTRVLRSQGTMNALICDEVPEDVSSLRSQDFTRGAVASVSRKARAVFPARGDKKFAVALIDYGAKQNIIENLTARGCEVTLWPQDSLAEEILFSRPDGVMLSNGPGDPAENEFCIAQIAKLVGQLPLFGICLGHQLTALALGGRTVKLPYGHRGANQPVNDPATGRTWITSQNHGYAVVAGSLAGVGVQSFVNANDGSCEGMDYPGRRCFTVQFHPEAHAGPRDTSFLFDRFIRMMAGGAQ